MYPDMGHGLRFANRDGVIGLQAAETDLRILPDGRGTVASVAGEQKRQGAGAVAGAG